MDMFLEERRQNILKILKEKKKATVSELANIFAVSEVTIRKDLEALEKLNLLERTHGGAIIGEAIVDVPAIYQRKILNKEVKEKIGAKAIDLINDNEIIILDSGTTTFEIAKNIKMFNSLTVITNSLEICTELTKYDGIRVIATGGEIIKDNLSMRSLVAEQMLQNYKATKAFIGVSALSIEHGFTTSDGIAANIKKQMIKSAETVIVVSDSSKFGKVSFCPVCEYDEIDVLITDRNISREYLDAFTSKGIDVIMV